MTAERIFVFEFITGGGWFLIDPPSPPSGSLLAEGAAMRSALASDFAKLDDAAVHGLTDARLGELASPAHDTAVASEADMWTALSREARAADYCVVIAPEFDGCLAKIVQHVTDAGGRLLSPGLPVVTLAADKHQTASQLANAGVPTPKGELLPAGEPATAPAFDYVVKSRFGAGSDNVQLLPGKSQQIEAADFDRRVERFCPGQPVSVACLLGSAEALFLPPCSQRFADDGRFSYLGGVVPLDPALAQRATRLAKQAVAALPAGQGYIGIDLVLGEATDGSDDFVIEINPRLTTSYVGLREVLNNNLAEAMIDVAEESPVALSPNGRRVEFTAQGEIHDL